MRAVHVWSQKRGIGFLCFLPNSLFPNSLLLLSDPNPFQIHMLKSEPRRMMVLEVKPLEMA